MTPRSLNRDRFVLSAGHGSMLLYSLLFLTGYDLTLDDLSTSGVGAAEPPGIRSGGAAPASR